MSRAEFLNSLKTKADTEEAKKEAEKANRLETTSANVAKLKPMLAAYKTDLVQMGVTVRVYGLDDDRDYVSFKMIYNDGGHFGFQFKDGQVESLFTNDDGKNYVGSSDMRLWDPKLTEEKVEEFVKKEIESFFFYADRHRGYKSEPYRNPG